MTAAPLATPSGEDVDASCAASAVLCSVWTRGGHRRPELHPEYTLTKPPTCPKKRGHLSKVWGESLARHYSDDFGLSVISLRIGFVNAEDRPTNARLVSVWCNQRDIVNAIELAVDMDDSVRYDVFFVNSDNKWGYRDLSHARGARLRARGCRGGLSAVSAETVVASV